MKTASVHELKSELVLLKQDRLVELCLRLARFKKENKELLTYLLFEANDELAFVEIVKRVIDEEFKAINRSSMYYVRKSLRKIIRMINKYSRYTSIEESELEWRLFFCQTLLASGIPIEKNTAINGIYQQQSAKIKSLLKDLHEDIQYEYAAKIKALGKENF